MEKGREEIHTEAETKIHRNHPSKSKTKVKGLALEPAFLSEMKGLAWREGTRRWGKGQGYRTSLKWKDGEILSQRIPGTGLQQGHFKDNSLQLHLGSTLPPRGLDVWKPSRLRHLMLRCGHDKKPHFWLSWILRVLVGNFPVGSLWLVHMFSFVSH